MTLRAGTAPGFTPQPSIRTAEPPTTVGPSCAGGRLRTSASTPSLLNFPQLRAPSDVAASRDLADSGGGGHQAPIGGDVCNADPALPGIDHCLECHHIDPAMFVVRNRAYFTTGAPDDLEIGNPDEWLSHSDHMPLIFDVDLEQVIRERAITR